MVACWHAPLESTDVMGDKQTTAPVATGMGVTDINGGGGGARLLEGVEKQQKYHVWVTGTENQAVSR